MITVHFARWSFCATLIVLGCFCVSPVRAQVMDATSTASTSSTTINQMVGATSTTPVVAEPIAPLIFQMRDGRFYHPASGTYAGSREELLQMLVALNAIPALNAISALNAIPALNAVAGVGTSTTTTVPTVIVSSLVDSIRRGRALLSGDVEKDRGTKPKTVKVDDGTRNVVLAVWNRITDDIERVQVKKKGGTVRLLEDQPFKIRVARSATLNSEYVIDDPNFLVVAVRYPIYRERKITRRTSVYDIEDAVYTPYASAIATPDVIENGKQYLARTIDEAFIELRRANVQSKAVAGKPIGLVIDASLVKTVTAIEHVDTKTTVNDPHTSLEVFFTTVGANEERAYVYDLSPAGAHGLAQFIPSTYKSLSKRTEYGLNPDFEKGMSDPKNALKSQIAYLDLLMAELPDCDDSATGTARRDEFAVAAYNTGGARVRKAAGKWDLIFDPSREGKRLAAKQKYDLAFANAEEAKQRMKKATDPKKVAEYSSLLARYRKEYRAAEKQVNALAVTTLKKETVDYIKKYRALLPYMQSMEMMADIGRVSLTSG